MRGEGEKKKKKLVIDRFEFSDLDLFLEEGTEGEVSKSLFSATRGFSY